jgi:hypothetical protein
MLIPEKKSVFIEGLPAKAPRSSWEVKKKMKISTKGRYGLRALIDLSINGRNGLPVLLSDIAKRQGISDKYLEQIATQLHRAGIVKTVRGRKGGYLLNKADKDIRVSDVMEVQVHCLFYAGYMDIAEPQDRRGFVQLYAG